MYNVFHIPMIGIPKIFLLGGCTRYKYIQFYSSITLQPHYISSLSFVWFSAHVV